MLPVYILTYSKKKKQADNGISTVVSTHEALEWAHPFVPSLDNNLLHGYFFRNIIKSVK